MAAADRSTCHAPCKSKGRAQLPGSCAWMLGGTGGLIVKRRSSPVGQHILDGLGETDNAYEYIESLMPLIGEVVIFFTSLESDLDHRICEFISDRSDMNGLLVLQNTMYRTKVDLYQRFSAEHIRMLDLDMGGLDALVEALKECGTLRNRVVHANWQYTDDEGFTQVRIKFGKKGLEHELWQFSIESMHQVIEKIQATREMLDEFDEEFASQYSAQCQRTQDSDESAN
jgi:hypothetical protein